MKKTIFTCLILLFTCNVFAQMQKADSLENLLNTGKLSNKEQLDILKKLCIEYRYVDLEKTKLYSDKGLYIAKKEKDYESAWRFCSHRVLAYLSVEDYDSALIYCTQALDWAIMSQDQFSVASTHNTFGSIYMDINNLDTALEHLLTGLSIAEKIDNKGMCAMASYNIGSVYRGLNQIDMSYKYFVKADSLAKEINDYKIQAIANQDIALLYINMEKEENALTYIQKALKISQDNNLKRQEMRCLDIMATVYRALKDYDKALECANKCIQIIEESTKTEREKKIALRDIWIEMSAIYLEQKRYKESEALAIKVWKTDSLWNGARYNTYILTLSNIYLGNKNEAVYFFEQNSLLQGRDFDDNLQRSTIEMQTKYETEKKEMRIAALEKEKNLYTIIGAAGVAILLLAFGLLFFRHRINIQKRKLSEQQLEISEQKVKQLEQEQLLVATQAVLDGEAAERSRLARDLHDGLGGMLSVVKLNLKDMKHYAIMDGSDVESYMKALDMLDQSIGELRRVAHHIMPESLMRYGLKVSLEDFCRAVPGAHFQYLGENPRLDSRLEVLIYRCAYELVNNAVKHANATAINVQLMVDSGIVSLTVHDNGVGFDPQTVKSGIGLENIRTRIALYNGKMAIHSSPETGTEISIEIEQLNND